MTKNKEIILSDTMTDEKFRYLLINELRSLDSYLRSISKSLERIANPPIKLDLNDPDAVKKASQSLQSLRG